jgi:hypothetical protein
LPASDAPVGGCTGFIEADRMLVLSAQVPAPVGTDAPYVTAAGGAAMLVDGASGEAVPAVPAVASSLLWRAYLQYAGEQRGAAEATLATLLLSALGSDGRPAAAVLDEAVVRASEAIVDTLPVSGGAASLSLLVDSQLQDKVNRHGPLLGMLADSLLLSSAEYEERDATDRVWDFLSNAARQTIVANAEKLAAASRLRKVENLHASRGRGRHASSFRGPSTVGGSERSVATSARTVSTAMFGTVVDDLLDEAAEEGVRSIVAEALCVAAAGALEDLGVDAETRGAIDDPEVVMYGMPSQLQRFLPALRSCMVAVVARAVENGAGGRGGTGVDDDQTAAVSTRVRRLACRDILLASDAALAVVEAANEVREEVQASHSFDVTFMEPNGGWSCHPVMSRAVLNDLAKAALQAAESCRPSEAKVLRRCAVTVSGALLTCARNAHLEEQLRSGSPGGNPTKSPSKRRRLTKGDEENSIWGAERLAVLTRLREHNLDKDAFALAHKFEDFGMMLTVKCNESDFDSFLEDAVEEFGREFAMFSFEWLERRGEIKLLVFGYANPVGSVAVTSSSQRGRSLTVKKYLVEYFRRNRSNVSNLSWMLQLASGHFAAAADGLTNQAKALTVPSKPSSLPNAKVLLSVAKLALIAARPSGDADGDGDEQGGVAASSRSSVATAADVNRRLYLLRAQSRLDPDADAILPADELVKRFLRAAPVDSGSLAEAIVLALEALSQSELSALEARELRDYVWRQCIERQAHYWIPLLSGARGSGDAELRHQLTNTALYEAACRVSLRPADARDLIARGVMDLEDVASAAQAGKNLARMIQTAVELADQAQPAAVS